MKVVPVFKPNFAKRGGNIPVIVQNSQTGQVLMLAYTNMEALEKTLREGILTLFSTSKNELWTKGGTSGNFMQVTGLDIDCDGDALLCHVVPQGNGLACHTNAESCFYRSLIRTENWIAADEAAPNAGAGEELTVIELPVHEDLFVVA